MSKPIVDHLVYFKREFKKNLRLDRQASRPRAVFALNEAQAEADIQRAAE
jgi:hypothetical protein